MDETNPELYSFYYATASYSLTVSGRAVITLARKIQECRCIVPSKGQRETTPYSLFRCTEKQQQNPTEAY